MNKQKKALVREFLERVGGDVLEDRQFRTVVAGMIKGHAGVYALYKNGRLYYIGLASNLMGRVKHHLVDRHAGKWNRFSVYLTSDGDHIKSIESLLLRISNPPGNKVEGKLPGARDLKRRINSLVADRQADDRAKLLGGVIAKRRLTRVAAGEGAAGVARLLDRRLMLVAEYKGRKYRATLRKDGTISHAGKRYSSPSTAARVIVGRGVNGWHFWKFRSDGRWVPLNDARR